jgi:hypothetical protein
VSDGERDEACAKNKSDAHTGILLESTKSPGERRLAEIDGYGGLERRGATLDARTTIRTGARTEVLVSLLKPSGTGSVGTGIWLEATWEVFPFKLCSLPCVAATSP